MHLDIERPFGLDAPKDIQVIREWLVGTATAFPP
jgi:hypothetical protein